MRAIEIDTDVFAKLWSLRATGEEDENAILRRVLGLATAQPPVVRSKEASTPEDGLTKMLWRQDVAGALRDLGGEAHLSEIYDRVRKRRLEGGRSVPTELEAIVRRELENNSSDAGAYTGKRDWFRTVDGLGKGRWALKERAGL